MTLQRHQVKRTAPSLAAGRAIVPLVLSVAIVYLTYAYREKRASPDSHLEVIHSQLEQFPAGLHCGALQGQSETSSSGIQALQFDEIDPD